MVCELEAGNPKYQVPTFQRMAAINSAKTIAKPEPLPTCRINSTGSNVMMVNATKPLESQDADEVAKAGPRHGQVGLHGMGIDDGCNGVGRIVKAVHELKSRARRTARRPARCTGRRTCLALPANRERG